MSKGHFESNVSNIKDTELIEIQSYITSYSAGRGTNFQDGIEKKEIPKLPGLKEKGLHLITIKGDSMSPTIQDGDQILIDVFSTNFKNGEIVGVYLNGEYMVKIFDPGSICVYLTSINQDYDPIRVYEEDDFHILGRAINLIREL